MLPRVSGPRRLKPAEADFSRQLAMASFGQDADADVPASKSCFSSVLPSGPETWAVVSNKRPVAQADYSIIAMRCHGCVAPVGHIGGVCTDPAFRGRGLAGQLLQVGFRRLRKAGARWVLVSGDRGLYRRSGLIPAGVFTAFKLTKANTGPPDPRVRLTPAEPKHAPWCARWHESEPVHYLRSRELYDGAFSGGPTGFRAERFVVLANGRPAAYFLLALPWEQVDHPRPTGRILFEYGGSRLALRAAFASLLRKPGIRTLRVVLPHQDLDLIQLLRQTGTRSSVAYLPDHTHRLLDLPGLLKDLRPTLCSRLPPALLQSFRCRQTSDGVVTLSCGPDRLSVDMEKATALVLGSETTGPAVARSAPGSLREICEALFPLPAVLAGLNFS